MPIWQTNDLESPTRSCFSPSADWGDGGPIIEREGIALDCWPGRETEYRWRAAIAATTVNACEYGPTPLIAAMRAFVASRGIAEGGSET